MANNIEPQLSGISESDIDAVENRAQERARQGTMDAVDLLVTVNHLSDAGRKSAAKELYLSWINHTVSPFAYVAHFNLGALLAADGEYSRAEQMNRKALELNPDLIQARLNLGSNLEQLGRAEESLEQWRTALTHKSIGNPENHELHLHALNNLGRLLESGKKFPLAQEALEKSLVLDPDQPDVLLHLGHLRQKQCTWPLNIIRKANSKAQSAVGCSPLALLAASNDPELQLAAARWFVGHKFQADNDTLAPAGGYRHRKIRVGYLSSDFCLHAVSLLTAELFELHDRDDFEVYGFCWSREDASALRARVSQAMDHFLRIGAMNDREAAECIRSHEIDILVDLQGLTSGARPLILSHRPAPVQMTYLGFPGTTGLPWIDYVIADSYVIPEGTAQFFTEKPLYLPHCFQVSDSKRPVGPMPRRLDNDLPENSVVFCSFNNNYKFTPELFAAWMRILKRTPESVLWLLADNEWAQENLLRTARKQGIKKERLIFAPRVSPAEYLARYQLADLFLDTFPFNGGTTANDALFMGLPLLTLSGRTFASRMAGSLLSNLGLPELIATNLKQYEEKAVRLGRKPAELAALRVRLRAAKESGLVFNTPRFVKEYESILKKLLAEAAGPVEPAVDPKEKGGGYGNGTGAWAATGHADAGTRSLLVQGWTGINHSFAMVNQYQLLSLAKTGSLRLFHQEIPYFDRQWNREKNGAGFAEGEEQALKQITVHSGEPTSAIYRIFSPFNLESAPARVLTFLVTELGLSAKSFSNATELKSYQDNGNYLVTPSQWSRERIVDFGVRPENIFVVPHGVDQTKFYPLDETSRKKIRTDLGYGDEDTVFLNVSAPLWNKGMDLLLRAFIIAREKNKHARLLIKDQQALYGLSAQQMIGKLAASGDIKLDDGALQAIRVIPATLSLEQLRSLYGIADYYVSPYRAEGFNLPVIEAIACGSRVIVTEGGATDDFCDGTTALKIPSTRREHVIVNGTPISAYLEPDFDALTEIWGNSTACNRVDPLHFAFARRDLVEKYTWDRAAKLLTALI